MKTLHTLIKLASQELDEKRRSLVALETQRDEAQKAIDRLDKELEYEREYAQTHAESQFMFAHFLKRVSLRKETINAHIAALTSQINPLAQEVAEAYSDLKKYEIALEHKEKEMLQDEKRRETIMFDDLATQQFLRKQE